MKTHDNAQSVHENLVYYYLRIFMGPTIAPPSDIVETEFVGNVVVVPLAAALKGHRRQHTRAASTSVNPT